MKDKRHPIRKLALQNLEDLNAQSHSQTLPSAEEIIRLGQTDPVRAEAMLMSLRHAASKPDAHHARKELARLKAMVDESGRALQQALVSIQAVLNRTIH